MVKAEVLSGQFRQNTWIKIKKQLLSLAFIRWRIGPLKIIVAPATSVANSREELVSRWGRVTGALAPCMKKEFWTYVWFGPYKAALEHNLIYLMVIGSPARCCR